MLHNNLKREDWFKLDVIEQMANIGSEVFRALSWRDKANEVYSGAANMKALELFDLTLDDPKHTSELKEIARSRELWLDYFVGGNNYKQTGEQWKKYFNNFAYAARNR